MQLAKQGSGACDGLLRTLAGNSRRAPLAPEAFAEVLATKQFTNGADASVVIELYRKTATALLGSTTTLSYEKLEWGADDYRHLGQALRYCGALETLALSRMAMSDVDAAALLVGAPVPSLQTLSLRGCTSLTTEAKEAAKQQVPKVCCVFFF